VTFYGVYPVSHYEIEMIFPKTWAWRKVTVITTIGGVSNIETIQNRDKHEGFEWTAPGTLKAGTRLIFNVLPESRRAGN
jgi:hypothetical protein